MLGKTCAYTICKNEIKKIDQWIYYTKDFDHRCILDTGSTDGTYELLKKVPNIILDQKSFTPFKFHEHRNYNLNMIPKDVEWCLSPDCDEYFSINVLEEMEKTINKFPQVTNIACDRLDIYSNVVRVGPPKLASTNKIHQRHTYEWRAPIYEHLWYTGPGREHEIYNDDIYLIHDQDITKPRTQQYGQLLIEQFKNDPTDCWNNWYLLNHYYREKNILPYIEVAVNFVKFTPNHDDKFATVFADLMNIVEYLDIDPIIKESIAKELNSLS